MRPAPCVRRPAFLLVKDGKSIGLPCFARRSWHGPICAVSGWKAPEHSFNGSPRSFVRSHAHQTQPRNRKYAYRFGRLRIGTVMRCPVRAPRNGKASARSHALVPPRRSPADIERRGEQVGLPARPCSQNAPATNSISGQHRRAFPGRGAGLVDRIALRVDRDRHWHVFDLKLIDRLHPQILERDRLCPFDCL